jgi:hypothetical protein
MAVFVINDASVRVGLTTTLTDLSDHCRTCSITYTVALQDKTAMGSSYVQRIAGLKDWSATLEFNQDYDASSVDATFWPIVGSSGGHIIIKPHSSAVGGGNPAYKGAFQMGSYNPIGGGAVGSVATVSVDVQGDGTLTRSTATT